MRRLLLALLLLALPAAAEPMAPDQARAILKGQRIGIDPDSLTQQIMDGKADTIDLMIKAGIDVNKHGHLPQSPLELAAMSCIADQVPPPTIIRIIGALVDAGADPNAPGVLGALITAAQQCPGPVVKRLIDAGAKIDARTPQGFTPLSMALVVKNYPAAETLIEAGARIPAATGQKFEGGPPDPRLADLLHRATAP